MQRFGPSCWWVLRAGLERRVFRVRPEAPVMEDLAVVMEEDIVGVEGRGELGRGCHNRPATRGG